MIEDRKIIEKGKQSLSFVEQLQNQIQLCREALSDCYIPLSPKVLALEILLWAKLKDDKEYLDKIKELDESFQKKKEALRINKPDLYDWQFEEATMPYIRTRAREQLKAIMIFIDKKNLMPIGEENE